MVHVLKCHPEPLAAIRDGRKAFEWRKEDDRRFEVDDVLVLLGYRKFVEGVGWDLQNAGYTGEVLKRRVTYVLRDRFEVPAGFAVIGIAPVPGETW